MKILKVKFSDDTTYDAIINNEELIYGVTAIAKRPCFSKNENLGKQKNLYAFHPLTNEKIDVIYLDDKELCDFPELIVPLHDIKHFALAQKFDLKLKQVVAPYFEGDGEQKVRTNLPVNLRKSVIAIVKHNKQDKYLCENSHTHFCKSFVLGGIEKDETPQQAALREIYEETGYKNVKIIKTSPITLHNHFYANYKGVNRYAYLTIVFCELINEDQDIRNNEETAKCDVLWLNKNDLLNFLSVNHNIFACNLLLNCDGPYEGDGKIINSFELDGLNRKEARVKINEIIKK